MPKHVLQIIEGAYRVTLEEQDDPALWITQAMTGAGQKSSVLLRGNAVNYAVRAQDASGVSIGGWRQTQPPRPAEDVAKMVAAGTDVYVVEEDVAARGLERGELISGLKSVARKELPKLV